MARVAAPLLVGMAGNGAHLAAPAAVAAVVTRAMGQEATMVDRALAAM